MLSKRRLACPFPIGQVAMSAATFATKCGASKLPENAPMDRQLRMMKNFASTQRAPSSKLEKEILLNTLAGGVPSGLGDSRTTASRIGANSVEFMPSSAIQD